MLSHVTTFHQLSLALKDTYVSVKKQADLTAQIATLVNHVTETHRLTGEDARQLTRGLKHLNPTRSYHPTGSIPDEYKPTLDDILLICKHYKIAVEMAEVLIWLHRHKIHSNANMDKLLGLVEIPHDLIALTYSKIFNSDEVLKQLLFDTMIAPASHTPPIPTVDAPIEKIAAQIEISAPLLQNILVLYHDMKEADKEQVVLKPDVKKSFPPIQDKQKIKNLTQEEVTTLIDDLEKLWQTDSATCIVNGKHLYIIAAMLAAASNPLPIPRNIPTDVDSIYAEYLASIKDDREYFKVIKQPMPVEHRQQLEKDHNNKSMATIYLQAVFEDKHAEEIVMSWKSGGLLFHCYDYSWIEQFIKIPAELIHNFPSTAAILAQSFNLDTEWQASVDDLNYITRHLVDRAPRTNEYQRFGRYEFRGLNIAAFQLATNLRWLGAYGLDTKKNKDIVFGWTDGLDTLTYIQIALAGNDKNKPFLQRFFDVVNARIKLYSENQNKPVVQANDAANPNRMFATSSAPKRGVEANDQSITKTRRTSL